MGKLLFWLGDTSLPYRRLMAEHRGFEIHGLHIPKTRCIIAEQTHSSHVHVCSEQDAGAGWDDKPQIMDTDALVTNVPHLFLLSRTADCTPILMYDPENQAVAAIHSGREGTRKNIAGKTIQTMHSAYQTDPTRLQVWIGAGICMNHYEVSQSIWEEFTATVRQDGIDVARMPFRRIDVQDVIRQQLSIAGVPSQNIRQVSTCTYDSDAYFSFRRDGSHNRQINIIGLCNG